jgi:multiple sugar transport system ATP-binding protein
MNLGEVQQIGTPRVLYNHPVNLFVAGFIGSPGMNFLPARIDGIQLTLPIGEIELSEEVRQNLPADCTQIVAGIRPEDFRLVESGNIATGELAFDVLIDVVEWLGAELFVYFDLKLPEKSLQTSWPEELCGKIRENEMLLVVARLAPSAFIRKGEKISLLLDTRKIQLFNHETGRNYARSLP